MAIRQYLIVDEEDTTLYRAAQEALVSDLQELTNAGLARWARRASEPEFVFCFIEGDMIAFEGAGDGGRPVDPAERVHAITCKYRNFTFLWLQDLCGWDALLHLLRSAPIDDEGWIAGYVRTNRLALAHLAHLAHRPIV